MLRVGVLMLLYGIASVSWAQWAWKDENGRTVYSDQPPPPNVMPGSIVMQPTPMAPVNDTSAAAPQPGSDAATAAKAGAQAPAAAHPPSIAEQEQEFRKRQKQRMEAEKKLAEQQTETTRKSEDCERARGYMQSLGAGIKLVRTNPDGSRELMDDEQRAAEVQRTQSIIDSRCN
jgi:type IV secretory pathway VirB10-like protein